MKLQLALLLPLLAGLAISRPAAAGEAAETAVRTFLLENLRAASPGGPDPKLTVAFADLNGDGAQEALVYVAGRDWCGAGGCVLFVLQPQGDSFVIRGRETVSRPPIRVLASRSKGWSDLGIWSSAGGVGGHEARIRFDGDRYMSNPAAAPRIHREPGKVLIAGGD